MLKHCVIIISGSVQGIGFRYYAQEKARSLGITGFVRNEKDGTVCIEAEGDEAFLRALIEWCRSGSSFARVDGVKCEWSDAKGAYRDFVIER